MIKQVRVVLREDIHSNPFILGAFKKNIELFRGSILNAAGKIAHVAIPGHMMDHLRNAPEVESCTIIEGDEMRDSRSGLGAGASAGAGAGKQVAVNSFTIPKPLGYSVGGILLLTAVYFLGRSHGKG